MRLLPVCVLAVLVPACASAATPTTIADADLARAEMLRDQALSDPTAYAIVESLTTEVGPRLAGSPNDALARVWAQAKFKQLGFDRVWTEPVTYPKWVRRAESARVVAPYSQRLVVSALGGSPATPTHGLQGTLAAFMDFDALKRADAASVKGKIVYIGYRMHAARDGSGYATATAGRSYGPALAAKLGAKAFLLRSAGTDSDRLPHTGITEFEVNAPQIPAAALSNPDADLVERLLARGQPVSIRLDLDCGVEGNYTGANVVGQINGMQRPDEVVAIGGHLDSWDPGTGAIDDGAGVAITMAAAHLIGTLPQRPKRSIRVIAFADEEAGSFGGRAYGAAHRDDVAAHLIGAESDFGAGRVWRLKVKVKPEAQTAVARIMQVLAPLGIERGTDEHVGGGDFDTIGEAGMALFDLNQDGTRYFDWHHSANDTLDKIDATELNQNVAAYAVFVYLAAQADGDFGSAPGAFADNKDRN